MESVMTRFTEKKCVATSHTTLQQISKIKCVERCNKERQNGRCVDDPQDAQDTPDEMAGVFFYEPDLSGKASNFYFCMIYIGL